MYLTNKAPLAQSSTKCGPLPIDVENKMTNYESQQETFKNVPARIEPNPLDKYNVNKFPHVEKRQDEDERPDEQSLEQIDPNNDAIFKLASKHRPRALRLKQHLLHFLNWDFKTKALQVDPGATMYRLLYTFATNNKTQMLSNETLLHVFRKLKQAGVPTNDYRVPPIISATDVSASPSVQKKNIDPADRVPSYWIV